eukprot:2152094-Pyramimonas_sp.AAC.1
MGPSSRGSRRRRRSSRASSRPSSTICRSSSRPISERNRTTLPLKPCGQPCSNDTCHLQSAFRST